MTVYLNVEAEVEDVAVLDDVVLAFQPQLAGIARAGLAVQRHVVVEGNGLGADGLHSGINYIEDLGHG